MQFLGGVQNLTFNPVSQYNQMLKNNEAFQVKEGALDGEVTAFDKVLNQQKVALNPTEDASQIQGGVAMNRVDAMSNIQDSQAASDQNNTGSLMNSLSNSMKSGLDSVNNLQESANKAQEALATGQDVSVHDVMIASEKSTLSLQMALQLRNKLLNAYSEINNVKV